MPKKADAEDALLDKEIARDKEKIEDLKKIRKSNALLRNRLESEVNEPLLRKHFQDNIPYLCDIKAGKIESHRHKEYHQSFGARQNLLYSQIVDPFTELHLDIVLEEMTKIWMSDRQEYRKNQEYIWKVLISEYFIKFYSDHFTIPKEEAISRIYDTPLHKKDRIKDSKDEKENDLSDSD